MDCDIFDKDGRMIPQSRDDWRTLHRAIQELEVGRGEIVPLHAIQGFDEDALPAELLAYKRACQAEEDHRARVSSEFWATVCAALALMTVGALIVKGPALMESAVKYFTGQ
tara:strand:+ start:134 stop:466 length:333 start_codon:yes stop_codon:yes gene_type:complete